MKYTYVPYKKVKPYKKEFETYLVEVKKELKEEYQVKCNIYPTGSVAKKLVTQNNECFDLDFNLEIIGNQRYPDKKLKNLIIEILNKKILQNNKYSYGKDSTSSITFHHKCEKVSIDIGILKRNKKNELERLIHDKKSDEYKWNLIKDSEDIENKARKLRKEKKLQNEIRKLYLKKKNNNTHSSPSFIIYIEVINELYNKYYNSSIKPQYKYLGKMTSNTALYYFNLFLNKKWVDKKNDFTFSCKQEKGIAYWSCVFGEFKSEGQRKKKKAKNEVCYLFLRNKFKI